MSDFLLGSLLGLEWGIIVGLFVTLLALKRAKHLETTSSLGCPESAEESSI